MMTLTLLMFRATRSFAPWGIVSTSQPVPADADEVIPHSENGLAFAAHVAAGVAHARAEDHLAPGERWVVADEDVIRRQALVIGEVILDDERVVRGEHGRPGQVRLIEPLDALADAAVVTHDVARGERRIADEEHPGIRERDGRDDPR
jgi:hypothetical protein